MEQNISDIKKRMVEFVDYQGISKRKFYRETGISNGILDKKGGISEENIQKYLSTYGNINAEWLLRGVGPMFKSEENFKEPDQGYFKQKTKASDVPYYNMPVTAGTNTEVFESDENPSGYLNIPGIHCIAFFPVIGFSMEPTIRNGDIIGIDNIDTWDRMDSDKIYYIITESDRMIKHIRAHDEDSEVLICMSPNFKEFNIHKENIKAIFKVVFYGRIV